MQNRWFLGLLSLFVFSCTPSSTPLNTEKGISYELATYRKQHLSNVHYQLRFTVPKEQTQKITANLKLTFDTEELNQPLQLDFNAETTLLQSMQVNEKNVEIQHKKEHIIIAQQHLNKGENTVDISFHLGEQSLNRNDDYLYTLLVPDRASTLFPCFDQPNLKATYQLNITAPKEWKVLTGAFLESETEKDNMTEHQFQKSDAMSSYLFSFVVGDFQLVKQHPGAFEMQLLYKETNQEKIAQSIDSIFAIHQHSLEFLESYTGLKFPYQKMDLAAIPGFQYGGMEHIGAIQYKESSLFLDKTATQSQLIGRAKLIAHETSHMWFGNWVTMRWFNDVWMKEVFANFMADKIVGESTPDEKFEVSFMMNHYPSAYSEDRTDGTNPIRQQLDNLKNAGTLYGRIIYNKAPIMMRQLESFIGAKTFQQGIQQYMHDFGNNNADWNDLISIFDALSEKDVKAWSEVWVNSSGRPMISDSIVYENDTIQSFVIQQKAEDGTDKLWSQFFQIGLVYNEEVKVLDVEMTEKTMHLNAAIGLPKPNTIIYNYNAFGYGVFPVVSEKPLLIQDEVARGYAYINLWETMLDGSISIRDAYQHYLEGISFEKNELILNYIASRVEEIFWKFFSAEERENEQLHLQKVLRNPLFADGKASKKRVLFQLYQSVSYAEFGRNALYDIWKGKSKIKNLQLNENDSISLAFQLAIFQHPKADEVLEIQQQHIKNKQAKERFIWLLPSVSNHEKVRDEFMISMKEPKNREKEPWVAAAMNNIHHPLRQASAIKHLQLSLDLLEEIQLTGDIFFPKRWLVSTIGNYTSPEAYEILNRFLNEHPDFPKPLLGKLLQSTDDLKRAQNIQKP